jgi:hypothetical protein
MKVLFVLAAVLLLAVSSTTAQLFGSVRGTYQISDVSLNGCGDYFPTALEVRFSSSGSLNRDIVTIHDITTGGDPQFFSESILITYEDIGGFSDRTEEFVVGNAAIDGASQTGATPCSLIVTNMMDQGANSYLLGFVCEYSSDTVCTARYTGGGGEFPTSPAPPPPTPVTPAPPSPPVTPSPPPATPPVEQIGQPCWFQPDDDDLFREAGSYSGGGIVSYSHVWECLNQTDFSSSNRVAIVDYMDTILETYVYRDASADTGDDYSVDVDLSEEFTRIDTESYGSDWELHNDIAAVMKSLRDPHTTYEFPSCYRPGQGFTFGQIFDLGVSTDFTEGAEVYVEGLSSTLGSCNLYEYLWNNTIADQDPSLVPYTGEDPYFYVGWKVLSISNVNAMDAIQNFADGQVPIKNSAIRFTEGIKYWNRRSSAGSMPTQEFERFELEHPVTGDRISVSVPWVACTQYKLGPNQYEDMCHPRVGSCFSNNKKRDDTTAVAPRNQHITRTSTHVLQDLWGEVVLSELEEDTAVLSLNGFTYQTSARMFFINALAVHRYNYRNLIVDTLRNSAGSSVNDVQGAYLDAAIIGAYERSDNPDSEARNWLTDPRRIAAYDMSRAAVWNEFWDWFANRPTADQVAICEATDNSLSQVCKLFENMYENNGNSASSLDDLAWYKSSVTHNRGGKDGQYSQYVDFPAVVALSPDLGNLFSTCPGQGAFQPDAIVILVDRTSNAAALFVRLMQEFHSAKVVSLGGRPGEFIDSQAAVAGVTFSTFTYLTAMEAARVRWGFLGSSNMPDFHPQDCSAGVNGYVHFATYKEDFQVNQDPEVDNVAIEFESVKADGRMPVWDAYTKDEAYYLATSYFACCFDWSDISNCEFDCTLDSASAVQMPAVLLFAAALFHFLFLRK